MVTIEDAVQIMGVIDGLRNGTSSRAAIVETLHSKLLEEPEDFWECYFEMLSAENPSHFRQLDR